MYYTNILLINEGNNNYEGDGRGPFRYREQISPTTSEVESNGNGVRFHD
jgi:hypothetical protein